MQPFKLIIKAFIQYFMQLIKKNSCIVRLRKFHALIKKKSCIVRLRKFHALKFGIHSR